MKDKRKTKQYLGQITIWGHSAALVEVRTLGVLPGSIFFQVKCLWNN